MNKKLLILFGIISLSALSYCMEKNKPHASIIEEPSVLPQTKHVQFESAIDDVLISPSVAAAVTQVAQRLVQTNVKKPNIIIQGPVGTGKTLLSKKLARQCAFYSLYFNLDTIIEKLNQMGKPQRLDYFAQIEAELGQLQEILRSSSQTHVIIFDKVDQAFGKRENSNDSKQRLLGLMLNFMTAVTMNDRDILVLVTSDPENLDEAVLLRFESFISVPLPDAPLRARLLKKYINQHLIHPEPSILSYEYWFGTAGVSRAPQVRLKIQEGIFSEEAVDKMAQQLEGLSHTEILNMIVRIANISYSSDDNMITQKIVERIIFETLRDKNLRK
jgi:SpoVK/Ycf46/Vps4 family AAA+-type ATPase